MSKAVVLFSGGLDSSACLALAIKRYGLQNVYCMSFKYGQSHEEVELEQGRRILDHYGLPGENRLLQELSFPAELVHSALLGSADNIATGSMDLPTNEPAATYVPGRNLLFCSYGNMWAETLGAKSIYIGVNEVDCSGYPDCTEAFMSFLSRAIGELGFGVQIVTPLAAMSKAEISKLAVELEVPLHLTHTCYRGMRPACGTCDSCLLRLKGFAEAGLKDSLEYV